MISAALVQAVSNLPTDPSALESSISALERAISALESNIKILETSSGRWEPWIWVFSSLVVLGVVMESWVIRHEWRDEMEEWAIWDFVGTHQSPSRPSTAKLRVEVASVLLIAIGVAGELVIGVEISHINGSIRGVSAQLRSKNADLQIASGQLVGLLNRKTEELKAENLKLEQQIQPRTLDDAARKNIGKELSKFAEHFSGRKIKVESYGGDAEGIAFSLEVMDVITKAGIEVDPVVGRIEPVGLVDTGLNITGPSGDEDFIRALANNIRAHLDTDVCGEWNPKYSELDILVAVKPIAGLTRFKSSNSTSPCSNVR